MTLVTDLVDSPQEASPLELGEGMGEQKEWRKRELRLVCKIKEKRLFKKFQKKFELSNTIGAEVTVNTYCIPDPSPTFQVCIGFNYVNLPFRWLYFLAAEGTERWYGPTLFTVNLSVIT